MLTADLDGDDEKDKGALDNLLAQLIAELGMDKKVNQRCVPGVAGCSRERCGKPPSAGLGWRCEGFVRSLSQVLLP